MDQKSGSERDKGRGESGVEWTFPRHHHHPLSKGGRGGRSLLRHEDRRSVWIKKIKKSIRGENTIKDPLSLPPLANHHHRSLCLSLCPSLFLDFHSSRPLSRVEAWKSLFGWGHRVWVALARLIKTFFFSRLYLRPTSAPPIHGYFFPRINQRESLNDNYVDIRPVNSRSENPEFHPRNFGFWRKDLSACCREQKLTELQPRARKQNDFFFSSRYFSLNFHAFRSFFDLLFRMVGHTQ